MAGKIQKLRSALIPEIGLNLDPEFVQEIEISTDMQRTISHLAARTGQRSIALRATSDGRLLVAAAGTAMEIYEVIADDAPDAYPDPPDYNRDDAVYVTDILIENFDAVVSFRNSEGDYGNDKIIPVGFMSIDLIHYGIRIENRVALSVAAFEITMYR